MKYLIPIAWLTSDDMEVYPSLIVIEDAETPIDALKQARAILEKDGINSCDEGEYCSVWHSDYETPGPSDEEGWVVSNPIALDGLDRYTKLDIINKHYKLT